MAVYTELGADEIAAAVRPFGLGAPDRFRPEPKGGVNTNYHVWSGGERWFLRLAEGKTEADLRFEAQALEFLRAARFPAPALRLAEDGRPWAPVAGKLAMVFTYAPGEEIAPGAATPERCRRVGEVLARLHDLASGFSGERANPYGPARVRAWIEALGADAGGDREVADALPLLQEELARAAALPSAPRGLVHGDLFVDNVLWIGDRVSFVLDWEMSCVEAFAYDLAIAINQWCWDGAYDAPQASALLAGYAGRRRPEPETLEALPAHARYAALRFAASRIHGYHRASLGADRLVRKDWRRQRDRLLALRAMGDAGFRALLGR